MTRENENDGGELGWVQVALAHGPTNAGMIVEYLRAEGIKAVAWQEGAGNALGLYVGAMGTARIMVPETDAEEALALLEVDEGYDESLAEEGEESSNLTKAMLGATAVVMSPIGAGIALGLSYFLGGDANDESGLSIDCRECGTGLELSTEEAEQGWYKCPECQQIVHLVVLSRCPNCQTELELNDKEVSQRWYQCSECEKVVQLR